MYSPKGSVRVCEHDGRRWKTLQLNGRKCSSLHSGFVHVILAPRRVTAAVVRKHNSKE
jgi:hypothetical protein